MRINLFLLIVISFFAFSCSKSSSTSNNVIVPTIKLSTIESMEFLTVSDTSISFKTTISSDGGSQITERGICYSSNGNLPTINDSYLSGGSGTGSFTSTISTLTPNTTYNFRAYAKNNVGIAYSPQFTARTLRRYYIGEYYGGGRIFYIDSTGQHGLIATSTYGTDGSWGCSGNFLPNCNNTAIGTGSSNTNAIVTRCTYTGIAAEACYNLVRDGYDDWYLPSKDELNLMYQNKNIIGFFVNGDYWSSSQYDATTAWIQNFTTGQQSITSSWAQKSIHNFVRPIRSF